MHSLHYLTSTNVTHWCKDENLNNFILHKLILNFNHFIGFSSLVFNSTRSEFYASCMDDIIYRHSTLGLQTQPIATYSGHQNSSFYVKSALSRDDGLLLSGSGDGKAYIWNVSKEGMRLLLVLGRLNAFR